MLTKVISGGQTGSDQAGWRAAKALGVPTGGLMPLGFWAEDGGHPEFAEMYGASEVKECGAGARGSSLRMRTWLNVRQSDATIWFGDNQSRGARATLGDCRKLGRTYWEVRSERDSAFTPDAIARGLIYYGVGVLNVAGNRESVSPGIGEWVERYMREVIERLRG